MDVIKVARCILEKCFLSGGKGESTYPGGPRNGLHNRTSQAKKILLTTKRRIESRQEKRHRTWKICIYGCVRRREGSRNYKNVGELIQHEDITLVRVKVRVSVRG